jgi:hypothetical protein
MTLIKFSWQQLKGCNLSKERTLIFLAGCTLVSLSLPFYYDSIVPGSNAEWFVIADYASVVLSAAFCLYYFFTFESVGLWSNRAIFAVVGLAFCLHVAAFICIWRRDAFVLVLSTFGISWGFAWIDHLIGQRHSDFTKRDEYMASFILADLPAITGLAFLWLGSLRRSVDPEFAVFLSGASAFQLILCNVTFFIIQLGLHKYSSAPTAGSAQ